MNRATWTVAGFALACSVSSVAHAEGDDGKRTEEARGRFQRGVDLYKDGDYRAAIIEFRRAYELVQNWRIHYNIAQSCAEVQDYPCAKRELEAYLAQGGAEIPEERRATATAELRRASARIALLTVKVNRSNAEIFVDEQSVAMGTTREATAVSAGRRRVAATLPGGQTVAKVVDIAGGDALTVNLDFVDAAPAPAPAVGTVDKRPANWTPVYIGLGITGVFVGATAVTGVLALGAKDELDKAIDKVPGSEADIEDSRSRTRTLALVTDVLGGAAAVAAGVTLYLVATRGSGSPPAAQSGAASLAVTAGPSSLGLKGRF
ncbi:MAG: hypothetical protein IPG50_39150 [Myxococcales bacterium]|nr:hypothetical protein [Myxococcales bacterium]